MPPDDLSKLKIEKSTAVFRPRRRKTLLYLSLLLIAVVSLGFLYFQGILMPAVEVELATVSQTYPSQAFTTLNASGYVVAQRKAAVSSKTTSRLVSLSVEEGSRVREGEIIARLEADDVIASREQAKAALEVSLHNLDQARAELNDASLAFNRNKELLTHGYVSQAEYDASDARHRKAVAALAAAEASVKASTAALEAAKVAVEYTLIRAPFDAVVLTKNADVGDIVTPIGAAANAKAAVVTIADMGSLQVEVDVSESNLGLVKAGQPCEIQLDALPAVRFRGVVHMIVPTADRTKATVMVKIRFADKDSRILPEMSAKVAFLERPVGPEEQKPRTTLNPAALVKRNGAQVVFVAKNDRAVETKVTTGEKIGDFVEVLEGVSPGDKIVLRPLDKVRNGVKIREAEK
jgi:RND family efflux transporter MFP subunit